MPSLIVVTRRLLWIALLAVAGGVALAWWRGRSSGPEGAPAQWPPLEPVSTPESTPQSTPESTGDGAPADSAHGASATVTEPATGTPPPVWVEPAADGSCPVGYPVKLKASSGIVHEPGGRFYDRTNADRCYASVEAAEADGYRRSKS